MSTDLGTEPWGWCSAHDSPIVHRGSTTWQLQCQCGGETWDWYTGYGPPTEGLVSVSPQGWKLGLPGGAGVRPEMSYDDSQTITEGTKTAGVNVDPLTGAIDTSTGGPWHW